MNKCIRGREVTVAIRRGRRGEPQEFHIVCPAPWSKSTLLRYVRAEHPDDSVRLVDWRRIGTGKWSLDGTGLWIANPDGFADYIRGHPAERSAQ